MMQSDNDKNITTLIVSLRLLHPIIAVLLSNIYLRAFYIQNSVQSHDHSMAILSKSRRGRKTVQEGLKPEEQEKKKNQFCPLFFEEEEQEEQQEEGQEIDPEQ